MSKVEREFLSALLDWGIGYYTSTLEFLMDWSVDGELPN